MRCINSGIACGTDPLIALMDNPNSFILLRILIANLSTAIRRTIIYQNQFPIRERLI